jgi:hypothetical protein
MRDKGTRAELLHIVVVPRVFGSFTPSPGLATAAQAPLLPFKKGLGRGRPVGKKLKENNLVTYMWVPHIIIKVETPSRGCC